MVERDVLEGVFQPRWFCDLLALGPDRDSGWKTDVAGRAQWQVWAAYNGGNSLLSTTVSSRAANHTASATQSGESVGTEDPSQTGMETKGKQKLEQAAG